MKAEVEARNRSVTVRVTNGTEVQAPAEPGVNDNGQGTGLLNSLPHQDPDGPQKTGETDVSGTLQCVDVSDLVWMDPASPLGMIDLHLGRRRQRSKAANSSPQSGEPVAIRGWYSLNRHPQLLTGRYVVSTKDERVGLLHVDINAAFDATEDWCTLVVLDTPDGKASCRSYAASQIQMPQSLHQHLLRQSINWYVGHIYNGLLEHQLGRATSPSVIENAKVLVMHGYTSARLSMLIDWLQWTFWGRGFGSERPSLQQLRRLADEAKKVWGDGPDPDHVDDMFGLGGELRRLDTDGSDERRDPHPSGYLPTLVRIMSAYKRLRDLKNGGTAKGDATPDTAAHDGPVEVMEP